jgi:hypothetical protein
VRQGAIRGEEEARGDAQLLVRRRVVWLLMQVPSSANFLLVKTSFTIYELTR